MKLIAFSTITIASLLVTASPIAAQDYVSPNGVRTLSPEGGIVPTATWSLGTRAGDYVFVAGMRGIDPEANALVPDDEGRVRQAFLNMQLIAESEGATLRDAVRLVVYVTDMYRYRPIVNQIQEEL
ncbi:RidA family protein [cf. Phormidesmis sp. LEGE 11477]|uniref:RidA family protein n=1 Tax=cf. Phormidesmis sp. LEGE 11477 TaxID=1828680 RepID=UPI001D13BBCA|nr:RidA family protein [cf. Phormidesmis sp. LEGE 11477]